MVMPGLPRSRRLQKDAFRRLKVLHTGCERGGGLQLDSCGHDAGMRIFLQHD